METGVKQIILVDESYPIEWPFRTVYRSSESDMSVYLDDNFRAVTGGVVATGKRYADILSDSGAAWNQTFGALTALDSGDGTFEPFDGVFGVGWDPFGDLTPRVDSAPILNLMKANRLAKPLIIVEVGKRGASMWYDKKPPAKAHLVPFVKSDLGLPTFNVDGFKFKDYADRTTTIALVDTGYSILSLPAAQYRVVYKYASPEYDWETGLYFVDCGDNGARQPKLIFQIGGKEYGIREHAYVLDLDNEEETCVWAIGQSPDSEPVYRLGMPFVRTYQITFDGVNNQMGFAK